MTKIKNRYSEYFSHEEGEFKYTFDFERIKRDFPEFYDLDSNQKKSQELIDDVIAAVDTELILSKETKRKEKYDVLKISHINGNDRLHALYLQIEDSKKLNFSEGIRSNLQADDGEWYSCNCVDFDDEKGILFVQTNKRIIGRKGRIYFDTSFIIEALREKLYSLKKDNFEEDIPAIKFLEERTNEVSRLKINRGIVKYDFLSSLDNSQKKAVEKVLLHDLSFIWGPPGTGKSYTLASLIGYFFSINSNTLVCCISNVAVDELLNKFIDRIEEFQIKPTDCSIMRAGSTVDNRLLSLNYLFPIGEEIENLRHKLKEINQKISKISNKNKAEISTEEIELKLHRSQLKEALKNIVEEIIANSSITFTTISHYLLSQKLTNKSFDNLIIDEASMVSMPYLLGLVAKISKRIIVVGDPNQLSPISYSPGEIMSKNVFDWCEVLNDKSPHPALSRLKNQRRSVKQIVNILNRHFYNGELIAEREESPKWVYDGPYPGIVIKVLNSEIPDNKVKMIGTSRQNLGTFRCVMSVLESFDRYSRNNNLNISIGVITPFRRQIGLIKSEIKKYSANGFWEKIKVGTIHSFQGSECDLIIIDLVEAKPTKVSKIFFDKEGERLINVALSRAKDKLIIIGDTERFLCSEGTASMTDKLCRLLYGLRDVRAKTLP